MNFAWLEDEMNSNSLFVFVLPG